VDTGRNVTLKELQVILKASCIYITEYYRLSVLLLYLPARPNLCS